MDVDNTSRESQTQVSENIDDTEGKIEESQTEEPVFDTKADTPFEKYTTKSWFKSFVFGILLGLAIVIPGISGAAVAIIFKLYDKLIYSFANIFRQFKACIIFLLPIILGLIVGFVIGFFAVQYLIDLVPFSMICLFGGLMIGALPSVFDEVRGTKITKSTVILFIVGLIIPILVGVIAILLEDDPTGAYGVQLGETSYAEAGDIADGTFGDFPWWIYVVALPIGFALGITQVVPGLSATAFLMMIGYYKPLIDTVHISYFSEHPQIFAFYVILLVGLIAGFIVTSKILERLFKWNRQAVYKFIVGLSVGSAIGMFINPDTYGIYLSWPEAFGNSTLMIVDISLAVPLLAIGIIGAYLLVKVGRGDFKKKTIQS